VWAGAGSGIGASNEKTFSGVSSEKVIAIVAASRARRGSDNS
jgi:hypothetical protein